MPFVMPDLHLIAKVQGGEEGVGVFCVVPPCELESWKRAMTLDQLRLSVDEMRARINDKIGDVLDYDLDCTSAQGRGELLRL